MAGKFADVGFADFFFVDFFLGSVIFIQPILEWQQSLCAYVFCDPIDIVVVRSHNISRHLLEAFFTDENRAQNGVGATIKPDVQGHRVDLKGFGFGVGSNRCLHLDERKLCQICNNHFAVGSVCLLIGERLVLITDFFLQIRQLRSDLPRAINILRESQAMREIFNRETLHMLHWKIEQWDSLILRKHLLVFEDQAYDAQKQNYNSTPKKA